MPLNTWIQQKLWSRYPPFEPFEKEFWCKVAQSLVPPSESLKRAIWREYSALDSPQLSHASERRRLRKQCQRYLRQQLRNNPLMSAVQEHLHQWVQELLDRGLMPAPLRIIRKLRDIEAETNDYYSRLAEEVAPPSTFSEEKLDGEPLPPIVLGSISAKEAQNIVSLLWEFAVRGEGGNKPQLTRGSAIWGILGIDPHKLETISSEEGLLLCLSRFEALLGLRGQPPEENKLLQLAKWVIRTHLPSDQPPETTPEARSKAMKAGLIHRGLKVIDEESGEVVQMDVEDRSIVQPEDMLDLDDSDRLLRFAELVGIDINEFTPREQERMLGLLDFFEKGNEKSSKMGISFKDYYGGKSDSEKTQRAKLFQEIRERTSHPYLKD